MPNLFHLTVISCQMKIFDGSLQSMIVPAGTGYLGVLANHAPLMSTLTSGDITLKDADGKTTSLKSSDGGFLEISNNKAVILIDTGE